MIAGGALVTPGAQVPAGQLWAGSPAKFRRPVTDREKEYSPYNADIYVRLARTYR